MGHLQVRAPSHRRDRLRLHPDRLPGRQGGLRARRDGVGPGGGATSRSPAVGTLEVDGETVEMRPGRYVLVSPSSRRRPAAGPDGMSFLVIGGVPAASTSPGRCPRNDRPHRPLAARRDDAVVRPAAAPAGRPRAAPVSGRRARQRGGRARWSPRAWPTTTSRCRRSSTSSSASWGATRTSTRSSTSSERTQRAMR